MGKGDASFEGNNTQDDQYGYVDDFELFGDEEEEILPGRHWLWDVFKQSQPSTLLEDNGQTSTLLGPHKPGAMGLLNGSYNITVELPFETENLTVYLCAGSWKAQSKILCRMENPVQTQRRICELPVVLLLVERKGCFVNLFRLKASKGHRDLWACLKFATYESTFIHHCSLGPWVVAL